MSDRTYLDFVDPGRLRREYPTGLAMFQAYEHLGEDELRSIQDERLQRSLARAWQTPFYRDRWHAVGAEPGDVRSVEQLGLLPVFDKSDLMADIASRPPFGTAHAEDSYAPADAPPVVLQTTSGTTADPQPVLFGPWGRETANVLAARMFNWLGVGPHDIVHSVYGHGTVNGGHYLREAVTHFTSAKFLSAGTGVETPSVRQVALMRQFRPTVLIGFGDYLRHLAQVAREQGIDPVTDIPVRMILGHFPARHRASVEADWGAPAYDWYGVADTGCIAAEGPDRTGLYVWEDAHFVEIVDDAGQPTEPSEDGDIVVTCLYKDDIAPIIRFNTHDRSSWSLESPGFDLPFRRISGFHGRSDNMVKIRGINVYPHALAASFDADAQLTGEYFCRAIREPSGREDLVVIVEHRSPESADSVDYADRLRAVIGLRPIVQLVGPGDTAQLTGIERKQKPNRLIDER